MTKVKSGEFEIAQRLKRLRLEYGASMTQISNLLGISRPTVYEMEKGIRSITLMETITLLSYYGLGIEAITSVIFQDSSNQQDQLENIMATELGRLTSTSFTRVIAKASQMRQSPLKEGESKQRPIGIAQANQNILQSKANINAKDLKP